ncbi:hypothetical protein HMPREF3213_00282 [Heyndrickxia coagulans]|uniref:Uncharacterized protein n=1 Tax=Heyndrickxia coagulans TaxID=1398 RepID=A0A133L2E5_HEYCO|nr:hypothetical protein HMPREF3213_00282 [Heyndrickxia coagulans]
MFQGVRSHEPAMDAFFIFFGRMRALGMCGRGSHPKSSRMEALREGVSGGPCEFVWPCFSFVCCSLLVFFYPDGHSIVQSLDKESGDQDE